MMSAVEKQRIEPRKIDIIYFFFVGLVSIIFFVVWTYINYRMYQSLNLHVFDLGIAFELPYKIAHLNFTLFYPQKMIYFLFSPVVYLFPNPFTLVVIENLFIALTEPVMFVLAKRFTQSNWRAFLISMIFLFGYQFFGAAYFPVHYQTFFSFFFLMAFYFLTVSKRFLFLIFSILASLTSFLGIATICLFSIILLCPKVRSYFTNDKKTKFGSKIIEIYPEFFSLFFTIVILIFNIIYYGGIHNILSIGNVSTNAPTATYNTSPFSNIVILKSTYFILLFLPFGSTFLRSKYMILVIPFFSLLILSNFTHYEYFYYPYTFDISSVLFLSFVTNTNLRIKSVNKKSTTRLSKRVIQYLNSISPRITFAVFIVLLLDLSFLPFGPFNGNIGVNSNLPVYDLALAQQMKSTQNDNYVENMFSLIPLNSSVLIQENMPQLTNRELWFEPFSYPNFSAANYMITDPYDSSFVSNETPATIVLSHNSMLSWYTLLSSSGKYGFLAEENGSILLEKYYSGAPQKFIPYDGSIYSFEFLNYSELYHTGKANYALVNSPVSIRNLTNYYSAFSSQKSPIMLPPGNYRITFILRTNNLSPNNSATLGIGKFGLNILGSTEITGDSFSKVGTWTAFSFYVNTTLYNFNEFFSLYNTHWNGTLSLKEVNFIQISPPSSIIYE